MCRREKVYFIFYLKWMPNNHPLFPLYDCNKTFLLFYFFNSVLESSQVILPFCCCCFYMWRFFCYLRYLHFTFSIINHKLSTNRKEGNVLFNDALNTFHLRLYGVRHVVKDHSDSEKGNPLPPHGLLFPINSKGSFICRIAHTMAFVTPVVEHWLEWEIAPWRIDPTTHRTMSERSYHGATSCS